MSRPGAMGAFWDRRARENAFYFVDSRVLRPGGWAAFHVSNDPSLHRRRTGLAQKAAARLGRAPGGQDEPEWLGSAVQTDDLNRAARDGDMELERLVGEGTQYCLALCRK